MELGLYFTICIIVYIFSIIISNKKQGDVRLNLIIEAVNTAISLDKN